MPSKLFAHSRLDALLVLLALIQLAVVLYGALSFGAVPWWHSLIAGADLGLPDEHQLQVYGP